MTAFRRHRSRDSRKPAFSGGFPDRSRDITEVFPRDGWDGATFGLPVPAPSGRDTQPLALLRAQPGYRPPAPAPDAGVPGGACDAWGLDFGQEGGRATRQPYPDPPAPPGPRDTGPQQRLPRMTRVRERARPQRPADCAIFVWVPSTSQHVLLCSMCLWRRHADSAAGGKPFGFEALRDSAAAAGWRTDAFSGWCCPACQDTARYHAPRAVTHSHPVLRRRHKTGQAASEAEAQALLAAVRGRTVVSAEDGTVRDAGEYVCGIAEHDLIRDVAAARYGRHAGGAR